MAASILKGALPKNAEGDEAAEDLIVSSDMEYETRAVELGTGLADVLALAKRDRRGSAKCRLTDLRKILYEARWTSALFDTRRWVRDLEDAYEIAWKRWVDGEGGDIWL
jgi:predicted O-linked N-acetylglucosamine transferase (SPINDLY family)